MPSNPHKGQSLNIVHRPSIQNMMAPQWSIGAIIIEAVARNLKEKLRKYKMRIIIAMARNLKLKLKTANWQKPQGSGVYFTISRAQVSRMIGILSSDGSSDLWWQWAKFQFGSYYLPWSSLATPPPPSTPLVIGEIDLSGGSSCRQEEKEEEDHRRDH